ncbi:hypothetical protein RJD24_14700 [Bacillaceae bacterium IKA-2]|nr:hypothetical protein RJD24_14700 [Bacillaceae bacterium IKA-2]
MPIIKENLPFPIVQYPLGAFVVFKQNEKSEYIFCSCMKEAVKNYISLRLYQNDIYLRLRGKNFLDFKEKNIESYYVLSTKDFPTELVRKLIKDKVPENEKIINYIPFEDKLCHECNKAIPSIRFCNPMYGGKFKQKFGWYIQKKYYENGVLPSSFYYKKDLVSDELLELLDFKYSDLFEQVREKECLNKYSDDEINQVLNELDDSHIEGTNKTISSNDFEHIWAYEVSKIVDKRHRKINTIIENEVRLRFDHKKIGEAWTSETILYNIVERLFPQMTLKRHYRPKILDYLELDIFIEEFNIGIEYQGIQHFKPIKHWGGKPALKKTKERDNKKKDLCQKHGIKLVYFNYNEELSEEFVNNRLVEHL